MNSWPVVPLGTVLPFKYGKGLPERVRSHSGEFEVMSSAGRVGTHNSPLTSGASVVIGRKGNVGSVFYSPAPVYPIDTTFYVEGSNDIDIRFAYYLLTYLPLRQMNSDSAVPGLNRSHAESLEIALPPLGEQRGIAMTLGALDDKVRSNAHAVQIALDLLDALSSRMSARLPKVALGSLVKVDRSMVNPASFGDARVAHYSLPAFDVDARPDVGPASAIMSSKLVLRGPTILLSRLNPRFNRTWWISPKEGLPALASTEFAALTSHSEESLAAVWLAIRNEFFREELARRVTGTSGSHQRVRPADLLTMLVPDVSKLESDVPRLALALLQLVERRREETALLEKLRDELMPQLLAGLIRVREAEEIQK